MTKFEFKNGGKNLWMLENDPKVYLQNLKKNVEILLKIDQNV